MNRVTISLLSLLSIVGLAVSASAAAGESSSAPASEPRHWVVYLVQHTHTDIGYTRPQSEILPEHLRFIDEALDACDRTDDYPDDAKFRWTCESSWAVREYLKRRPASQVERFKKRVAEGRIEVTAMLLNMSEIATESSLAESLQPIRSFREEFGIPVRLAMQDDVNGAAWCLVDYFHDSGVKYLTMGINKTRSLLPFDMPTAFWWESPSGKRTLAFRAEHYMAGNIKCRIHDGSAETVGAKLQEYLDSLEKQGYPFDCVSLQYSGQVTDNSPPGTHACDVVKAWNETHEWPKLRSATASEFMDNVAVRYGDTLPVYRTAWPDWWTDGFGSAARETAASRETHAGMQATQGLMAMASLAGGGLSPNAMKRAADVQEGLLLYDEHTFGAYNSISDPMCENAMVQWAEKSSYVWDAVQGAGMLREEALGVLEPGLSRGKTPRLIVFNTLNWKRSGLVQVFVDRELVPAKVEARFMDAETGERLPSRWINDRVDGTSWIVWAKDIPPLGYKTYEIQAGDARQADADKPGPPDGVTSNDFYSVKLDPKTGAIVSLQDKETGLELVDTGCPWQLGQLIYERRKEGRDLKYDDFQRSTLRNVKIESVSAEPIWQGLQIKGDLEGCAEPDSVRVEIRLYNTEKRIELHFNLRKLPVREPEAVYVALPFQLAGGKIVYEAQGGTVSPGKDQLPGSASDWQTVQNFITVQSPQGQIICGSDQVPLVQLGDINLGKWQPVTQVDKPHVYSWVMNNYWYTNFRATQEGEFGWSYYLTSTRNASVSEATRFGWGSRVPLVPRVIPPGNGEGKLSDSLIRCDASNLLLVESRPARDGQGIVLHWREVEGKPATLDLGNQPFASRMATADVVNVLEQPLEQGVFSVSFAPFEVKFVKVNLK